MTSTDSRLHRFWRNSYVKTILLAAIIIGGVVAFWFGLQIGLRTQYPLLTVASGSMVPTLNVGDLIAVEGISNAADLKAGPNPVGDTVVFKSPRTENELIVHRAVDKTLYQGVWYIRTRGDANGAADYWAGPDTGPNNTPAAGMISQNLLIGKVVGKVPWLGYIPLYIRSPSGIVLIIVLMAIIILAEYIPSMGKKQKPEA